MTLWKWSKTAADNANSDSTINWAENQAPSSVNNSARAEMAAIAKARDDWSGMLNTGGSLTAYTISSNQNLTALTDGFRISARVHTTSGASPTLSVDSLTAKPIRIYTSEALPTGALNGGGIYTFTYDSGDDCWYAHGYFLQEEEFASGTKMLFWQTNAPTGWTKDTDNDDSALRVTSGTVSTGGSVAFETAFASKSVTGTVGNTTLTVNQIPAHGHPFRSSDQNAANNGANGAFVTADQGNIANRAAFSGTPSSSTGEQIGGTGGGAPHTHTFSGTAIDLDVQFVDVILATKD